MTVASTSSAPTESPQPAVTLTQDEQRAYRKRLWLDRLTSGWSPAAVFAIAFLLYLLVVELHTPAYGWAAPLLKAFALLMLVWMFGAWVARLALRRFGELRKVRHAGRELVTDVRSVLERHGADLGPKIKEELWAASHAVMASVATDDLQKIEAEVKTLAERADRALARWRKNSAFDVGMGLAKALAIALLIRAVVLEPFKIPSGSMIPTLAIGDQIFVNKFIYGVRIPWLNIVPFVIAREPKRGDIIVFENPFEPSKDFIKRVVAIPGDKIEISDRKLILNGLPQEHVILDPSWGYWEKRGDEWVERHARLVQEELEGSPHPILLDRTEWPAPDGGPWTVPEKHVFVLGDNRDNSQDSRFGLGRMRPIDLAQGSFDVQYVPYGRIKGKAMVIWLSLSHGGFLSGFFGGTGLRTDRLFLPVR